MYKKVKRWDRVANNQKRNSFKTKIKDIFWSNKNTYHKIDYAQKREYLTIRNRQKRIPLKKKIEILLLSLFIILFFGLISFHPFFKIKEVKVSGLNRIDKNEFTEAVFNVIRCKKIFVFSCDAYVFVDVDEIRDVMFDKYSLNNISIKKIFPGVIEIDLEEKISTIVYDDGETYSFVDLLGHYVETIVNVSEDEWYMDTEITTSTDSFENKNNKFHIPNSKRIYNEIGNYPLVYDKREDKSDLETILKPDFVMSLIEWYNYFNNDLAESVNYFTLLNSVGDTSIQTYNSWYATVRLGERFESQSNQLKYIVNKEINGQAFNYIELRYPDRVYWK